MATASLLVDSATDGDYGDDEGDYDERNSAFGAVQIWGTFDGCTVSLLAQAENAADPHVLNSWTGPAFVERMWLGANVRYQARISGAGGSTEVSMTITT